MDGFTLVTRADEIPGWFSNEEADAIARACPPEGILVEIGTWMGRSTAMLAERLPNVRIFTVDSYPETAAARKYAQDGGHPTGDPAGHAAANLAAYPNVHRMLQNSIEAAKTWSGPCVPVDVLFVDGEHQREQIENELRAWRLYVPAGGWIFLHDGKNSGQWAAEVVPAAAAVLVPPEWERVPEAEAESLLAYRRRG